jgi:hypothetical protein
VTKESDKKKTVTVSEDYLVFLHDELSENIVRLREILGDSQAQAVFSWSADRLVATVGGGKNPINPLDGIIEKLRSWGMEAEVRSKGDTIEVVMKCPYAEVVHPRLSSKEPKCPLGEYVLGAVRLEDEKSLMLRNDLTTGGVKLRIKRQGK